MPSRQIQELALALTDGIGWKLLNRLLIRFGSLDPVFEASLTDLQSVQGIGPILAARLKAIDFKQIATRAAEIEAQGITISTWNAPDYPAAFHMLEDKPLVVFRKGALSPADDQAIAIVGSREAGQPALDFARELAAACAKAYWTVISGLARGVDSQAHLGALEAGGRTIAVLGSGLNRIYPPENGTLAAQMTQNGAILSENAPEAEPTRDVLVYRNRLITALSRATVVVEAGISSGALHAARRARAQGRRVYALPNSTGNRDLIAAGHAEALPHDVREAVRRLISAD